MTVRPESKTRIRSRLLQSRRTANLENDRIYGNLKFIAAADAAIVIGALSVAQILRFGANDLLHPNGTLQVPATLVSICLAVCWLGALQMFQSRASRVVGTGHQEYSRVLTACFSVFGLLAILDLLFRLNIARGFLVIALPLGTFCLILNRALWRSRIYTSRSRGEGLKNLFVVGSMTSATTLIGRVLQNPIYGFMPSGIWYPHTMEQTADYVRIGSHQISVFPPEANLLNCIRESRAQAVAVSSSDVYSPEALRELTWELDAIGVDLLVSPGLLDIAAPRMTLRHSEGLPLLHIDRPQYGAAQSVMKIVLDLTLAATLTILTLPIMLVTAVAIKLDDGGPIFFSQIRVGKDGQAFRLWKFRSMRNCAASSPPVPIRKESEPDRNVFYKSQSDPRITRVGRVIRKTSIDELPQLFNVLLCQMSVVGPRPLLTGEGSEIPNFVERRLLASIHRSAFAVW